MLKVAGIEGASLGVVDSEDENVYIVKKVTPECYKKIFLKDKHVIGAILIGCKSEAMKVKKMIKERTVIDEPETLL